MRFVQQIKRFDEFCSNRNDKRIYDDEVVFVNTDDERLDWPSMLTSTGFRCNIQVESNLKKPQDSCFEIFFILSHATRLYTSPEEG
jgi:hypothetical protein